MIVDLATLTGAQGISTGKTHGAIVTNNEDYEKACVQAGRWSGDLAVCQFHYHKPFRLLGFEYDICQPFHNVMHGINGLESQYSRIPNSSPPPPLINLHFSLNSLWKLVGHPVY